MTPPWLRYDAFERAVPGGLDHGGGNATFQPTFVVEIAPARSGRNAPRARDDEDVEIRTHEERTSTKATTSRLRWARDALRSRATDSAHIGNGNGGPRSLGQEGRDVVVHVVRLGSPRLEDEGTRIGTVRRPPRGVPRSEFASRNWYDVWLPNLAPSAELMKLGQGADTPGQWAVFRRKYEAEMRSPENRHLLELLAVLSHQSHFSVGCYCEEEAYCHRSLLRELLKERGARLGPLTR